MGNESVSGQLNLDCTECHFINLIEPTEDLALYMPKQVVRGGGGGGDLSRNFSKRRKLKGISMGKRSFTYMFGFGLVSGVVKVFLVNSLKLARKLYSNVAQ